MSHGDEISREKNILKISFETATCFAFALQVPFPGYFNWCPLVRWPEQLGEFYLLLACPQPLRLPSPQGLLCLFLSKKQAKDWSTDLKPGLTFVLPPVILLWFQVGIGFSAEPKATKMKCEGLLLSNLTTPLPLHRPTLCLLTKSPPRAGNESWH